MSQTDLRPARRSLIQSLFGMAGVFASGLFGAVGAAPRAAAEAAGHAAGGQGTQPPLFSSVTTHNGFVFVAGKGEHTAGDIKAHTTSVLNQLEAELKKAGASMEKVLKVNVYLHDIKDYDGMNEVFRGRFGPRPPVRTTVACYGGVPGSSLVEMDCIAAL